MHDFTSCAFFANCIHIFSNSRFFVFIDANVHNVAKRTFGDRFCSGRSASRAQRKSFRMAFFVVVSFLIFYTPAYGMNLLEAFGWRPASYGGFVVQVSAAHYGQHLYFT